MSRPPVKKHEAFNETTIDGEIVVLNLADGAFFSLTGTAAAIWTLIDGARDRASILDELVYRYGEDRNLIAPDLDAFLAELAGAGFLADA